MHIISTVRKLKVKSKKAKVKNLGLIGILIFGFWVLDLACGCGQKDGLKEAQNYFQQSQTDYQRAVNIYKGLIAKGKDTDQLNFELIYYPHGIPGAQIARRVKTEGGQTRRSPYRLGH
jgi:hypothetical protein